MFNLEERRHWQRSPTLVPHKGGLALQTAHAESVGAEILSGISAGANGRLATVHRWRRADR